jgi:hypothetical protein
MLSCLVVSYTQRPSGFKATIKWIFKTKLIFVNVVSLLLADSLALSFLKFTKSCKNAFKNEIYLQEIYQSSKQEMFAISLSSCSRYNANFKFDQSQCSLFMTVRHIFEISEDDHPRTVSHARDHWWTLDFANAFASPGANSRGELLPTHGASCRRLCDIREL